MDNDWHDEDSLGLLFGLYKTFVSEEVTEDNHFLSATGPVGSVVHAVSHPFWDWMADSFGFRFGFVL